MITKQMVIKFATRSAAINRLQERQKALREEILTDLKDGQELPDDCPYTIDLSQNGGKEFSWEDEYEDLLTKRYEEKGNKPKAARALARDKMKRMKENAPDKEAVVINGISYVGGVKLTPKPNPDYKVRAA